MALLKKSPRIFAVGALLASLGGGLVPPLVLVGGPAQVWAVPPPSSSREYQIKAVFLFNFAQFVDWPAETFPSPETPLVIGIMGDDPFGPILEETMLGEHVGQRTLVIRRYRRVEDIDQCHILFISASEADRLESIMLGLKDRSVLTVCDTEGFAKRGVMIRFMNEKNKIRLRINLEMVKASGLTLSSKLLRSAEIVTTAQY